MSRYTDKANKKTEHFSVICFPAFPINSEFIMAFCMMLWNVESLVLKPQGR